MSLVIIIELMQVELNVGSAVGFALDSPAKEGRATTGIGNKLTDSTSGDTVHASGLESTLTLPSTPPLVENSAINRDSERTSSARGIPYPPQFYEQDRSGGIRNSGRILSISVGRRNYGTSGTSTPLLGHLHAGTGHRPGEKREFKDSNDLEMALHAVFLAFARFGNRSDSQHLDSFRFMKLCRECCLTTDLCDTQCVDLIFYQVRATLCFTPLLVSSTLNEKDIVWQLHRIVQGVVRVRRVGPFSQLTLRCSGMPVLASQLLVA